MGASHSHSHWHPGPPLVDISGTRSPILIPAGPVYGARGPVYPRLACLLGNNNNNNNNNNRSSSRSRSSSSSSSSRQARPPRYYQDPLGYAAPPYGTRGRPRTTWSSGASSVSESSTAFSADTAPPPGRGARRGTGRGVGEPGRGRASSVGFSPPPPPPPPRAPMDKSDFAGEYPGQGAPGMPGYAVAPPGYVAGPPPPPPPPPPPLRAHMELPPPASRMNQGQAGAQSAGPSGQDWIDGEPFLGACSCTADCDCRKVHRALYRAKAQGGDGPNGWGEIRYVLKDDGGRNCRDHSKCRCQEVEGNEGRRKNGRMTEKKRRGGSEDRGLEEELKEELREQRRAMKAMQDEFADLKMKEKSPAFTIPWPPPHPDVMDGMDLRVFARRNRDPYSMGSAPVRHPAPGTAGPMGASRYTRRARRPPDDMDYDDDDVPFSEPPFDTDDMVREPPRRRGRGGPRGPRPPDMDMHPSGHHGPLPTRGRGMGGRHPRFGDRPRPPTAMEEDDWPPMRAGRGRAEYRDMDEEDDNGGWGG